MSEEGSRPEQQPNHSNLDFVGLDHTYPSPEQSQHIKDAINRNNSIVVEYFPPEILSNSITSHGIKTYDSIKAGWMNSYTQIITLYQEVADYAASCDKTITVLDPAHDANFILLTRLTLSSLGVAAAGLTANDLTATLLSKKQISRRQFLKIASGSATSALLLGTQAKLSANQSQENLSMQPASFDNPNEALLRRIIIAKGLQNMNDSTAVIYSPQHCAGLKQLLATPEKLNSAYTTIATAAKILQPALLLGRKYTYDKSATKWNLATTWEIN